MADQVSTQYDEASDTHHVGITVDGQFISVASIAGEQARTNAANLNAAAEAAKAEAGNAK